MKACGAIWEGRMRIGDYEILDDRFRHLVKVAAKVEKLYEGCRWAEGPAYFPAHRYLVWSDIPNDRMLRWDETTGRAGSSPASTATGASRARSMTGASPSSPTASRASASTAQTTSS